MAAPYGTLHVLEFPGLRVREVVGVLPTKVDFVDEYRV